jgi:hypothetical protein
VSTKARLGLAFGLIIFMSIANTVFAFPLGAYFDKGSASSLLAIFEQFTPAGASILIGANLGMDLLFFVLFLGALGDLVRQQRISAILIGVVLPLLLAEKRFGLLVSLLYGWHVANFYTADGYLFKRGMMVPTLYSIASFLPFVAYTAVLVLALLLTISGRMSVPVARLLITAESERKLESVAPFTTIGLALTVLACAAKFASLLIF